MSAFGALFDGISLKGQDGSVEAASLDGKAVVGLYFSAHWCPPCKMFTPKLADSYKQIKADSKDFEVVFVSSDRDEASFNEYFGEMPWLAVPFAAKEVAAKLSQQFSVSGIPTFVLLDGEGNILSKNGRSIIDDDPRGKKFPWTPPTLAESLGDSFLKGAETITAASLAGKTIGLYFSAHWCGPCRAFTPQLAAVYNKLQAAGTDFEIIFVSSDQDEASFDQYRATMPWAALPFDRRDEKKALSDRFEVEGIPTLVILENLETGKVINPAGRAAVSADPEGKDFPWHPKALNDLTQGADGINENPCLVALLGGGEVDADASVAAIGKVAAKAYDAARAAGKMHAQIRFFFAKTDASIAERVRELTKTKGPTLVLLDIPDNGGFYAQKIEGGALTEEAAQAMLDAYKAKSLERQQLS